MVSKRIIFDFTIPALYDAGIRSWSYDWLDLLSGTGFFEITIVTPIYFSELDRYGYVEVVPYNRIRVPLIHRFWYYHFRFRPYVKQMKSGTLVSPYFQLPKGILTTRKCIVCVHDTLYYDLAHYYRRFDLYILKLITNYFHKINLQYAHGVLTVSSYSFNRLKALFNLECIGIFYNVPKVSNKSKYSEIEVSEGKYFVYFGGWERRKRVQAAMKLAQFILEEDLSLKFVLSGVKDFAEISHFFDKDTSKRILCKLRFSKDEMLEFYGKSKFSLYTSAFEGFGIPLIESQLFGRPVVVMPDLELSEEIPRMGILTVHSVSKESAAEILTSLANFNSREISDTARNVVKQLEEHNKEVMSSLYEYL